MNSSTYIAAEQDLVSCLVNDSHDDDCIRARVREVVQTSSGRAGLLAGIVRPWEERGACELPACPCGIDRRSTRRAKLPVGQISSCPVPRHYRRRRITHLVARVPVDHATRLRKDRCLKRVERAHHSPRLREPELRTLGSHHRRLQHIVELGGVDMGDIKGEIR